MSQLTHREKSAYRKALLKKGIKTVTLRNDGGLIDAIYDNLEEAEIAALFASTTDDKPRITMQTEKPTQQKESKPDMTPTNEVVFTPRGVLDAPSANPNHNDLANMLAALLAGSQTQAPMLDTSEIKKIVSAEIEQLMLPTMVQVQLPDTDTPTPPETVHKDFETVLKAVTTKQNLCIVGPAGSGKTYCVEQIAKTLKLDYYFSGSVAQPYKLIGFIDAGGTFRDTPFYKAFTEGGLFCLDEMDGCSAEALMTLNAMLAGSEYGDFPNGMQKRHKDFFCVGTANTFGTGANRQYVGRNQLDAATLSRFMMMEFGYDENLERAFTNNNDWVNRVQELRRNAGKHNIRIVISPRASLQGAALLAQGLKRKLVEDMVIFKGIDKGQKDKILKG